MSNMLTSLYNVREKTKNKPSLKRTTLSSHMKLGNKPNKIGTKMEGGCSLFSHTVFHICILGRFLWFIYFSLSWKKETTVGFLSTYVEDVNWRWWLLFRSISGGKQRKLQQQNTVYTWKLKAFLQCPLD